MQYKELIQFEPITTVVKLVNASELSVAENLVKTFVFSQKMQEDLNQVVIKNLTTEPSYETRGIQIVGSYGTGKSHLMSVVSAIAENEILLSYIQNETLKENFKAIAGKYKVLRFEIGTDKPLKDVIFAQIERYINREGIDFKFDADSHFSWKELIQKMMAEFFVRGLKLVAKIPVRFPDVYFRRVIRRDDERGVIVVLIFLLKLTRP